jgi:hypothetical protein
MRSATPGRSGAWRVKRWLPAVLGIAALGGFALTRARSAAPAPQHASAPPGAPQSADSARWENVGALRAGPAAFGLIGDAVMGSGGQSFLLDVMERRIGIAGVDGAVAWTGRAGRGPGEFFVPVALAADAGVLYVLDRGNQRIERYRTAGGRLERSGSLALEFGPEDLCVSEGRLFVLGAHRGQAIHEVSTRDGRVLRSFAPDAQLSDDLLATFRAGGYLACGAGNQVAFLPLLRAEVRLFSAATGALLHTAALPGYNEVLIRRTADAVEFRAEGGTHDAGASVIPLGDGRMLVQVGAVRPGAATAHEFTSIRSYVVDWRQGSARVLGGALPRIAALRDGWALALDTDPHPAVRRLRLSLSPAAAS